MLFARFIVLMAVFPSFGESKNRVIILIRFVVERSSYCRNAGVIMSSMRIARMNREVDVKF